MATDGHGVETKETAPLRVHPWPSVFVCGLKFYLPARLQAVGGEIRNARLARQRQREGEGAAAAIRVRGAAEGAAVRLDDAPADREAHAEAGRLGGEKRLEDAVAHCRVQSDAGVGHRDFDLR